MLCVELAPNFPIDSLISFSQSQMNFVLLGFGFLSPGVCHLCGRRAMERENLVLHTPIAYRFLMDRQTNRAWSNLVLLAISQVLEEPSETIWNRVSAALPFVHIKFDSMD